MIPLNADLSVTHAQYEAVAKHFLEDIIDRLSGGETVRLKNIGVLQVRRTEARVFSNPKTGVKIAKPSGAQLKFRPSKKWRLYDAS